MKKGDTLSAIAKVQYGDESQWKKIYNANKSKIKDPKQLQPGTTLTSGMGTADKSKTLGG